MTDSSKTPHNPRLRLAVLILAAGQGSRLGGYPKALLQQNGISLLRRFCKSVTSFSPVETLVVTGFYSDQIEKEAQSINQELRGQITWVNNLNPNAGQSSSVRLGLESLKSDYDALLIALCDQPNIGALEIDALIEQFQQRLPGQEIILPIVKGQRGNPVLFSKGVIDKILSIPAMSCRPFMDEHSVLVRTFESENEAYVLDVDTSTDIQKLGLQKMNQ